MQTTTKPTHLSKLPSGSIMAVLCVTGASALPSDVNSFRVVQDSLAPAAFLTCDYRPRVKGAMNTEKHMNKTPSFEEWLAGKPLHFLLEKLLTTAHYTADTKSVALIQNVKVIHRYDFTRWTDASMRSKALKVMYAKILGERV